MGFPSMHRLSGEIVQEYWRQCNVVEMKVRNKMLTIESVRGKEDQNLQLCDEALFSETIFLLILDWSSSFCFVKLYVAPAFQ